MLENREIKELATNLGFDLCGVTYPRDFDRNRVKYKEWLERGDGEPLEYMGRYLDVRFDPSLLMDNTASIVVCAVNYKSSFSLKPYDESTPKIASYAHCTDYHTTIRKSLKALLREIKSLDPTIGGRCCVDTAPLLEKQLAVEAGLGWIGRQSLLVTPEFGTFVVLGVLLLDCAVDEYDAPLEVKGCAQCRRCVDSCPNGAINGDHTINSRRCISALTVECDNPYREPLHGWLFGCDECQRCCPYNQRTPMATNPKFQPIIDDLSVEEWLQMEANEFVEHTMGTPLKRGGFERVMRNIKD